MKSCKKLHNELSGRHFPSPIRKSNILGNNKLQGTSPALLQLACTFCGRAGLYLLFLVTLFCCKNDDVHFVEISELYAESCHLNEATLDATALGEEFDLSVKNPHKVEEVDERSAAEILESIEALNTSATALLKEIKAIL